MKHTLYLSILVFLLTWSFSESLIQIELKKSVAKFHHKYLQSFKFIQVNSQTEIFTSFLEEKDVPLHQQV
jgi:hypothetical protein